MSPVSNMQDFAIGMTDKRGSALPFDPIASRNADRPKFRLEDYEPREPAEPRQADPVRRERNMRADEADTRQAARHDNERALSRSAEDDRADNSRIARNASDDTATAAAARDTESRPAPPPRKDAAVRQSADEGKSEVRAEESAYKDANAAGEKTETAAVPETGESAVNAEQAHAAANASGDAAAGTQQTGETGKTTGQASPAGDPGALTGTSDDTAGDAQLSAATQAKGDAAAAAADAKSGQPIPAPETQNAAAQSAAGNAATEPARTATDPKLAALQQLTQPKSAPGETPAANAPEDKTSFTLPVPWPQKPGSQAASAATGGAAKPAADIPADAAARAAQAGADAAATASANDKGKASQATAAANAAAQNRPKIEIEVPAAARPQISSDTATVLANNRADGGMGQAKQGFLPSQSETIAAVTALNNRVPRSNALGAAQQSNAVTSAVEKTTAQNTANAGQATATVNAAATTVQPAAPNTGAAPTAMPVQLPAGSAETALGGRSQGGTGQGSLSEPGTHTSAPGRTAEAPSTSTAGSFGDSLRTAGTERSTPLPEARHSLPSAAAEQVKVKLVKAAVGGLDRIKIQLNPSELGKVEVRLEFGSDGGVRGIVTVEKPETLHLLQRDARQLEQALQDAGFNTDGESLEFQMRGGNTNERQQNAGTGNGSLSRAGGDLAAEEEQLETATAGTEQNGVGDDGSLNMVA